MSARHLRTLSSTSSSVLLCLSRYELCLERSSPSLINRYDDDDVELNIVVCRVDTLRTNCDQCISTVQCCFTSTETIRLIRTGSPGRPSRLSHSSWTLMVNRDSFCGRLSLLNQSRSALRCVLHHPTPRLTGSEKVWTCRLTCNKVCSFCGR